MNKKCIFETHVNQSLRNNTCIAFLISRALYGLYFKEFNAFF